MLTVYGSWRDLLTRDMGCLEWQYVPGVDDIIGVFVMENGLNICVVVGRDSRGRIGRVGDRVCSKFVTLGRLFLVQEGLSDDGVGLEARCRHVRCDVRSKIISFRRGVCGTDWVEYCVREWFWQKRLYGVSCFDCKSRGICTDIASAL